jgi:hypothetical protein
MYTVLLPLDDYPIAVTKYIIYIPCLVSIAKCNFITLQQIYKKEKEEEKETTGLLS